MHIFSGSLAETDVRAGVKHVNCNQFLVAFMASEEGQIKKEDQKTKVEQIFLYSHRKQKNLLHLFSGPLFFTWPSLDAVGLVLHCNHSRKSFHSLTVMEKKYSSLSCSHVKSLSFLSEGPLYQEDLHI